MNIVDKKKEQYLESEHRHQYILDAAIRVFNSKGYNMATTAEIAKEAGISEPTMYKHFLNKAALFMECFQLIVSQLLGIYRDIYKKNRDDEIAYLEGVSRAYIDFVLNNPDKSNFLVHLLSYKNDPNFNSAFNDFMESSINGITKVLNSAKQKGLVNISGDVRLSAVWFVSQYFTIVSLTEFVDKEQLTSENIIGLIRGLW